MYTSSRIICFLTVAMLCFYIRGEKISRSGEFCGCFLMILIKKKAPPKGQIVFDRLLKACNEVVWKGNTIIVLDTIKVDPPYTQDNCELLSKERSGQQKGSLDRVQKIVSSIGGGGGSGSVR